MAPEATPGLQSPFSHLAKKSILYHEAHLTSQCPWFLVAWFGSHVTCLNVMLSSVQGGFGARTVGPSDTLTPRGRAASAPPEPQWLEVQ